MPVFTKGLRNVTKKLEEAAEKYREATQVALYGQGIALDELMNRKGMVPKITGRLRSSHYVTPPQASGRLEMNEVGYGVDYAEEAHERQKSRSYHWMIRAVNIFANAFQIRLYENVMNAVKSGARMAGMGGAVPTSPQVTTTSGSFTKYQAKYGHTKEERKKIRTLAKEGAVKLVRRWKTPKKGVPRAKMYPKRKG
jgi:hypothetical protein